MNERKITISLEFGRRQAIALAALALVALHPAPLSTEQLTLNTYYPSPYGVYEEMRTRNNTYLAYAAGNVGIGKTSAGAKLDVLGTTILGGFTTVNGNEQVNGQLRVTQDSRFDQRVGIGGPITNIYATGVSVQGRNLHVQGNENGGWLRVGDAWGVNGIYSESGDLVIGSASGRVRVGPNDSFYIGNACRVVGYGGGQTFCPSRWTVMGPANQQIRTDRWQSMPNNGAWHTTSEVISSGQMLCCKLSTQ